jgi:thioredoxin-related protein
MDKTVYADPAIVALSRQEVFVKLNAEDGGQGQQFARQMRVRGYPTTIILDAQGKVLSVAQGYIASSKDFGEFVEDARGRAK